MQTIVKFLAGALFVALAGAAQAADAYKSGAITKDVTEYPIKADVGFAGAYVGVHATYDIMNVEHGGSVDWSKCGLHTKCVINEILDTDGFNPTGISGALPSLTGEQVTGGVRAGYNFQIGKVYFGPVAMFDLGGPSAGLAHEFYEGVGASGEVSVNWKATVAGKIGLQASDRVGVYALAGWTLADVDVDAEGHYGPLSIQKHHNDTVNGFTYGAGADVKLGGGWTGFAEYQHVDLSDFDASGSILDCVKYDYKAELALDTIKVGLTYTFN